MTEMAALLGGMLDALFILLGVVAVMTWARHRERERLELAAAMALLSLVIAFNLVVRATDVQSPYAEDVSIVLFIASGFALFRFRHLMMPSQPAVLRAGTAMNLGAVLFAVAVGLPPQTTPALTTLQSAALAAIVGVWLIDTGEPAIAFWRGSKNAQPLQRNRMRSLSVGYAGIIAILIVQVLTGRLTERADVQVVTELIALGLVPFLYASIAPPQILRQFWRHQEEAALRAATAGLVEFAPDTETLAQKSLPWAIRLLGADRGFVVNAQHRVLATEGVKRAEIEEILQQLTDNDLSVPARVTGIGASGRDVALVAAVPSRLGRAFLAVISSPFTPAIGEDEVQRLAEYVRDFANGYDRVQFTELIRMLQEVATTANDAASVADAASHILRLVCDYMGWPVGHVYIPSDETGGAPSAESSHVWVISDRAGLSDVARSIENNVGRRRGVVAEVLATGEPVVTDDLCHLETFVACDDAEKAGLSEGYWLPVRSRTDVVGVMQFLSSDGYTPDVSVIHALETAGTALGRVYERERAMGALRRAGEAKTEYLSRISHELRTPLTVIIGYADLLATQSPEEERGPLQAILANSNHLLGLVNDVLDISRIENRSETTTIEPVVVTDIITQALSVARPLAEMHHVRLGRDELAGTVRVNADRQHLVQALVNLVSNAIKYGGESKAVRVWTQPAADERLRICVSDNGPGIPEEKLSLLFVPFERIGAERTTISGSGLGLALVKRLAESMHGTAGVESEVGSGSTFWVELPLVTVADDSHDAAAKKPSKPARARNRSGHRVLFVDDNASTREFAERMFELRPEITLLTAASGEDALEAVAKEHPDAVVLDMHLPDINGDEVLRRLKRDTSTRDIPVIMLSADATPERMQRLISMGADRYVTKPIVVRDFLSVVDATLTGSPAAV